MKKKELTSHDEAINDWLDRNLFGLITFVVLVIAACSFLIYQMCKP